MLERSKQGADTATSAEGAAVAERAKQLFPPEEAPRSARSWSQRKSVPVVGQPSMIALYELVDRLARGSINILIGGETGVGKEVVAEAIHEKSPRRDAPLVRINCAALAEPLLESELFGHERGAFTGAINAKTGLIEAADGGTVFLDEVGELSLSLQAKLLRVLEAGEIARIGSIRPRRANVRFISATNRNLHAGVENGSFRADFSYRLNGAGLHVPPLRERPLEILPLAENFIERVAEQLGLPTIPVLSSRAKAGLHDHSWPGNIRELRNVIERAVLVCNSNTIELEDLTLRETLAPATDAACASGRPSVHAPALLPEPTNSRTIATTEEAERERIVRALVDCGGNQSRAANLLRMPRRTLVRRIAQLGLPRPRASSG